MKVTNRLHDCLGFNVNERTLQIEWVATWSPIEKQYNVHVVAAVAIVREL